MEKEQGNPREIKEELRNRPKTIIFTARPRLQRRIGDIKGKKRKRGEHAKIRRTKGSKRGNNLKKKEKSIDHCPRGAGRTKKSGRQPDSRDFDSPNVRPTHLCQATFKGGRNVCQGVKGRICVNQSGRIGKRVSREGREFTSQYLFREGGVQARGKPQESRMWNNGAPCDISLQMLEKEKDTGLVTIR